MKLKIKHKSCQLALMNDPAIGSVWEKKVSPKDEEFHYEICYYVMKYTSFTFSFWYMQMNKFLVWLHLWKSWWLGVKMWKVRVIFQGEKKNPFRILMREYRLGGGHRFYFPILTLTKTSHPENGICNG